MSVDLNKGKIYPCVSSEGKNSEISPSLCILKCQIPHQMFLRDAFVIGLLNVNYGRLPTIRPIVSWVVINIKHRLLRSRGTFRDCVTLYNTQFASHNKPKAKNPKFPIPSQIAFL